MRSQPRWGSGRGVAPPGGAQAARGAWHGEGALRREERSGLGARQPAGAAEADAARLALQGRSSLTTNPALRTMHSRPWGLHAAFPTGGELGRSKRAGRPGLKVRGEPRGHAGAAPGVGARPGPGWRSVRWAGSRASLRSPSGRPPPQPRSGARRAHSRAPPTPREAGEGKADARLCALTVSPTSRSVDVGDIPLSR